jgi:DNA-directed RNA polymerase alpha subunit
MKFLLEHLEGCAPLNPCASCKATELLRKRLSEQEMNIFIELVLQAYTVKKECATSTSLSSSLLRAEFDFTTRIFNALEFGNITTVGELASKTEGELLNLPNFGMKSLNEIKEALAEREIFLKA